MKRRITILSVNYNTAQFIRFQKWCLDRITSTDSVIEWKIIDNSPDPSEASKLPDGEGVRIIESDIRTTFAHGRGPAEFSPRSFQHGMALNRLLPMVNTDFGLIIDPDCFVLRRNWDRELTAALDFSAASAIGAPYHPMRRYKYGLDFPMVTFFFFRTQDLLPLDIDFAPGPYPNFESLTFRIAPLRRLLYNGHWKDTGWRLRDIFRSNNLSAICFDAPLLRRFHRGYWAQVFSRFVPERLLNAPRQPFRRPDSGLFSEDELFQSSAPPLYEEYYHQDNLFLCHLRGISQRGIGFDSEEAQSKIFRVARHLGLDYETFAKDG